MIEITEQDGIQIARFVGTDRFNATISEEVKEQLANVFATPNSSMVVDLSKFASLTVLALAYFFR